MVSELDIIKKLGLATSTEVQEILDKSLRNTIKQLNQLEIYGEIKIMIFKNDKHRKRIYITNEIYNNLLKS